MFAIYKISKLAIMLLISEVVQRVLVEKVAWCSLARAQVSLGQRRSAWDSLNQNERQTTKHNTTQYATIFRGSTAD